MRTIKSKNPYTGEELQEFNLHNDREIDLIIDSAQNTFLDFKETTFKERAQLMQKTALILEQRKNEFAEIITMEMGKVLSEGISEIEKCAWVCRYYAINAESFLADKTIETDASKSYVSYKPLGIVLAVMPWNYPFWQVFRFAAPALMAGNVALLKHASNVPHSALLIEEVFREAGFPEYVFKTVLAESTQVENILGNRFVKAATLTGSGPAGSSVSSISGKHIKKIVLELGGNDPYLILHDADLHLAAEQCTKTRLLNAGQSCIAGKRFIAVESVYQEFVERFKIEMSKVVMGDPMQAVNIGPMARHDLRDEVHEQVLESIKKGAILELGGTIPDSEAAFYPPTILTNVKRGMPAYDDEIFGPVASIIKVKDEEEAIKVANDTTFGLGSCVFTKDEKRGEDIARNRINAGACFVNQFVKSDPRLPFGGINESGYGRELSENGIHEFVNIKTVYVK